MRGCEFAEFKAFAAVAEHGSFVRASEHLGSDGIGHEPDHPNAGATPWRSTLSSHDAQRFADRCWSEAAGATRAGFAGTGRCCKGDRGTQAAAVWDVPHRHSTIAYVDHLQPILAGFQEKYPAVKLDITISDSITDIVAHG